MAMQVVTSSAGKSFFPFALLYGITDFWCIFIYLAESSRWGSDLFNIKVQVVPT